MDGTRLALHTTPMTLDCRYLLKLKVLLSINSPHRDHWSQRRHKKDQWALGACIRHRVFRKLGLGKDKRVRVMGMMEMAPGMRRLVGRSSAMACTVVVCQKWTEYHTSAMVCCRLGSAGEPTARGEEDHKLVAVQVVRVAYSLVSKAVTACMMVWKVMGMSGLAAGNCSLGLGVDMCWLVVQHSSAL